MRKEVIKPVKAFRILVRSIRDSFKSVFRNFSLSIASILCTTITLVLVAIAIIVTVNVNHITKDLEEELTILLETKRINKTATKIMSKTNLIDFNLTQRKCIKSSLLTIKVNAKKANANYSD